MKGSDNLQKIVVLIDADNAQLLKLKDILDEISAHGRVVVKKAFGDWKNPVLKNWEEELKQLAVKPEQQFGYVVGKNATDIAMVISAMDLLHTEMYDAFALVSSDSDFTPLAIRLRESGLYVFGVGEEKTPQSFRNSCDEFIFTEYLDTPKPTEASEITEPVESHSTKKKNVSGNKKELNDVHALLRLAYDKYQDESGYAYISSAGNYIKRARPDFNIQKLGVSKWSEFLEKYPQKYEINRLQSAAQGSIIIAYRCL